MKVETIRRFRDAVVDIELVLTEWSTGVETRFSLHELRRSCRSESCYTSKPLLECAKGAYGKELCLERADEMLRSYCGRMLESAPPAVSLNVDGQAAGGCSPVGGAA